MIEAGTAYLAQNSNLIRELELEVERDDKKKQLSAIFSKAISVMKAMPQSEHFRMPPTRLPGYLQKISKPMDLHTMSKKEYFNADEFLADLRLIASNCEQFNGVTSPYSDQARAMVKRGEEYIVEHAIELKAAAVEPSPMGSEQGTPARSPFLGAPSPSPLHYSAAAGGGTGAGGSAHGSPAASPARVDHSITGGKSGGAPGSTLVVHTGGDAQTMGPPRSPAVGFATPARSGGAGFPATSPEPSSTLDAGVFARPVGRAITFSTPASLTVGSGLSDSGGLGGAPTPTGAALPTPIRSLLTDSMISPSQGRSSQRSTAGNTSSLQLDVSASPFNSLNMFTGDSEPIDLPDQGAGDGLTEDGAEFPASQTGSYAGASGQTPAAGLGGMTPASDGGGFTAAVSATPSSARDLQDDSMIGVTTDDASVGLSSSNEANRSGGKNVWSAAVAGTATAPAPQNAGVAPMDTDATASAAGQDRAADTAGLLDDIDWDDPNPGNGTG